MSKAACLRCRTHHANPTTFGSWDENGGWNATREDVAASRLDPERYITMWERAADAMSAAHRAVDAAKDARRHMRRGSKEYRAMAEVINAMGLAACRAQEACWRLPHPSEVKNIRVGCVVGPY